MDISNPRRLLAVSLTSSEQLLSRFIKDLTGSHPVPSSLASLAGTTHVLSLRTSYYRADVPVWLDVIASPDDWAASFLSAEAREVLAALGGVAVVFDLPPAPAPELGLSLNPPQPQPQLQAKPGSVATEAAPGARDPTMTLETVAEPAKLAPPTSRPTREETRALIEAVGRVVRDGLGGWNWDGVALAVGVGETPGGPDGLDEWEDVCAEWGVEFVHVRTGPGASAGATTTNVEKNEFGEKVGIPRALEALEANDWAMGPSGEDDISDEQDEKGEDQSDFGEFVDGNSEQKAEPGTKTEGRGKGRGSEDNGRDLDPESLSFGFDREDFVGLRKAIWSAGRGDIDDDDEEFMNSAPAGSVPSGPDGKGGGKAEGDAGVSQGAERKRERAAKGDDAEVDLDDEEVRKLDRMMRKLQAVRDLSAGMPEDQRKRLAARAVGEVMKEL